MSGRCRSLGGAAPTPPAGGSLAARSSVRSAEWVAEQGERSRQGGGGDAARHGQASYAAAERREWARVQQAFETAVETGGGMEGCSHTPGLADFAASVGSGRKPSADGSNGTW
jgi:hypothetical protein